MTFGNRLRELIDKYNVSQRRLARESGVHYVTVNRIVNKYQFDVTDETAWKLIKALPCSKAERQELWRLTGDIPQDVKAALLASPRLMAMVKAEMKKG